MTSKGNGFVLWLTGLSGSGKSTLAEIIYEYVKKTGRAVERLDGDVLRGYFPSTGFAKADRDEHIKRVGFMSSLLEKHGVIVIASFISPYRETRDIVRNMCHNFIEVYVDCSLEQCKQRDVKGLYKKALAGEIKNFTGLDDPYEEPLKPEITVNTEKQSAEKSAEIIIDYIKKLI